MRNNHVYHLFEAWTFPVSPINVENERRRIVEWLGRLNLYILQSDGKVNAADVLVLQRLLTARNPPNVVSLAS
jgi:hypothetical protein